MTRDPEGLPELLGKVAGGLGLEDATVAFRLFGAWEAVVGPEVAARARPVSLRRGVLRIETDSPAWAAEVRYLAPELLRRANEALGVELARELKVGVRPGGRTAPRQQSGPSGDRRRGDPDRSDKRPAEPAGPSESDKSPIRDESLAAAVARARAAAQGIKEGRRAR